MDRYSLTGEDRKLIRNEVFRSVEWIMLDRGVIDEEIAEQRILPLLPERLHGAARGLIEKWDDPIVPVEGMLELLQALKAKGYRLYLLSNAATRQPIYWARAEASKLMVPQQIPVGLLVKLCNADTILVRRDVLGHDVHGQLCKVEVGADACRCGDAGVVQHLPHHGHGKFMGAHVVIGQVACHINKNFIDGVGVDIRRGHIF